MARRATPDAGGKRMPLMARITPAVRSKLEEAAEQSGRSLAQEVEMRLERSFDLPQIIETAIQRTAAHSTAGIEKLIEIVESNVITLAGGDDLLMLWSRLAFAIHRVEDDTGKSIRDDEATRNAAERAVLGAVPDLFRNLPPTYSNFRREAASRPRTTMLGDLGNSIKDAGMAPLGGWPSSSADKG